MANYKKISLDFHGVINSNPVFFGNLARLMKACGHTVYIVSGGPREYIAEYLAEHDIPYDVLWCIFDYFNAREKIKVAPDGSFHIDDELWNAAKGKFCSLERVDLHIDDSNVYGAYFTTPYAYFDTKEQSVTLDGKIIPIKLGTAKIADIISAYLSSGLH